VLAGFALAAGQLPLVVDQRAQDIALDLVQVGAGGQHQQRQGEGVGARGVIGAHRPIYYQCGGAGTVELLEEVGHGQARIGLTGDLQPRDGQVAPLERAEEGKGGAQRGHPLHGATEALLPSHQGGSLGKGDVPDVANRNVDLRGQHHIAA